MKQLIMTMELKAPGYRLNTTDKEYSIIDAERKGRENLVIEIVGRQECITATW